MYDSIVVPLDLGPADMRALAVAGVLARAGSLPVRLVVVSSPNIEHAGTRQLVAQRAEALGEAQWTVDVLESEDVAATLLEVLAERPGALPVLATHARGPVGRRVFGSVSEALVGAASSALVMVGPKVVAPPQPPLMLVVASDKDQMPEGARSAVGRWEETFGSGLAVVHTAIDAPVKALLDAVGPVPGHVLAAPTEDWPKETGAYWGSTTRSLVHEADCPVLVIPQSRQTHDAPPG
jgi:nucleotide-binding universal stress UspA family protein